MGKDKTPAWVPLLSAALSSPAISALVNKGDQQVGLLAQTFGTVLQSQQSAAQQQAEMFKLLMNRPSAADEISKMTGIFAQSQMTTMQMVNQIITSGLLDKGGGHPIVDLLSQIIDQGGQVLQSAVGGGSIGAVNNVGEASEVENVPLLPSPRDVSDVPQLAPQAAQAAPAKQYDLNADPSFRVIIDQIRGNGSAREIALRLYRHGQPLREDQGHPLAKAWCRDPASYSKLVLEQIGVSAERIEEITQALYELAEWVRQGKDAETFASVETRKRRKRKSIPAVHPEMRESFGYQFNPDTGVEETPEPEDDEDSEDEDEIDFSGGNGMDEEEKTRDLGPPRELLEPSAEQVSAVEG
jgi:hypothetical protein